MKAAISANAHLVILTGAGISKESGLDTFRDKDGIWSKVRLEDVARPEGFARDPALVHAFYNARRRQLVDPAIRPNPAHEALGRLEREWKGTVMLVTQNIDDLHERGGCTDVVHMHGELLKVFCVHCRVVRAHADDLTVEDSCPNCGLIGGMRPDVVWFGEMPYHMDRIFDALADCDLFVSIGTSGNVYPASGFVAEARRHGAHAVELNPEPSAGAGQFHEAIRGPATEIVPAFVDALLGTAGRQ